MDRFAIVVDGTASLTKDIEREFDIRWLPLHVDIGSETFTANVDLSADEFYRMIATPGVLTGTSQPNMGECRDVYDAIVREGISQLLVLTVATELSGTYSVASTTAQAVSGSRIEVIATFNSVTREYLMNYRRDRRHRHRVVRLLPLQHSRGRGLSQAILS